MSIKYYKPLSQAGDFEINYKSGASGIYIIKNKTLVKKIKTDYLCPTYNTYIDPRFNITEHNYRAIIGPPHNSRDMIPISGTNLFFKRMSQCIFDEWCYYKWTSGYNNEPEPANVNVYKTIMGL